MLFHHVLQPDISGLNFLKILALFLFHQKTEHDLHERREIFLYTGSYDKAQSGPGLQFFHYRVKSSEHYGHFSAALLECILKLSFTVKRINRYSDPACFPDSQLADNYIRTIGHEHGHPVTLLNTIGHKPAGHYITEMVYLAV